MKGKEGDLQVTGRKGLAMCMFVWPSPVPGHHSLSYFSLIKSFPDYLCICTLFSANSWRDLDVGEQSSAPAARVGLGKGTLARSAGCCSEWGWLPPATRQWPCGVPGGVVDGRTRGECVSTALEQWAPGWTRRSPMTWVWGPGTWVGIVICTRKVTIH